MAGLFAMVQRVALIATVGVATASTAEAADWTIGGTVLTPSGLLADGVVSVSGGAITAVGSSGSVPVSTPAIKVPGIILPGFIDLHNHLPWNVLPRWLPARKFANRYEWQDTAEYDRLLVQPHNVTRDTAACESEIYAEIKALAGGATSVVGSFLPDSTHPKIEECAAGLVRNLDLKSDLAFVPPDNNDPCEPPEASSDPTKLQPLLGLVDNEVFPMELPHARMDFLLCELRSRRLRSLIIHLSEGATSDSSAHREFVMLSRAKLLTEGLAVIHGTALRDQDFIEMANAHVGLIWSPRSNDELYGSTTNIAAAHQAKVPVAISPDWSPSGSAGMLQEIGYASRHYTSLTSDQLIAMATSVAAGIARLDDQIGTLAPNKRADLVVVSNTTTLANDPAVHTPLDRVVRATPADIVLVVVGGEALYGDPAVLARFLPPGAKTERITVCGVQKDIYLGQSAAAGKGLSGVLDALKASLARAGSSLPDIECD
jgi:5-methylthioadenosine/S-adenosylhomocysteine deaminase